MKIIIYALILGGTVFLGNQAMAQQRNEMSEGEHARMDSLETSYRNDQQALSQKTRDKENISNLKDKRKDTREKAKEARRNEQYANDAARESRNAYRAERKAQKARRNADTQAKKAAKARNKSS